jgi:RHS repeat-associated protein
VDGGTPVTTDYAWDMKRPLPVVLDDGTNQYVYGLDLISATDGAGAQTYFTYDGLGSATDLTNGSGAVTGTYSYDVFGAVRAQSGGGSNQWQFTGEQRDADSALYFLRARYYDPATGRFLAQDSAPGSAAIPQTLNQYAYTVNNPTNWTDPSGLCPLYDPRCIGEKVAGWLPAGVPWRGGRTELLATCLVYMNIPFADWGRCGTVAALGDLAFSLQDDYYGENTEGTPADRFQHCVWSGSIAIVYGSSFAKTITGRYEEYPGNDSNDKAFDLQSNRLGYEFIRDLDYDRDSFGLPKDIDGVLGQLVGHCKE